VSATFKNATVDFSSAISDPRKLAELSKAELFSITHEDAERYRLEASRKRFAALRDKVPMLQRLADELEINEVESLENLAPLLFSQTVYNSYPIGWLERSDFERMTKWLDKLTSVDLSGVDASSCELIEEWLEVMKEQSALELNYSATKGGKMSFMPREKSDWQFYLKQFLNTLQPFSGEREWSDLVREHDKVPLFHPGPRKSGRPLSRILDVYEEWFGEGLVKTSVDSMDADLMSISGRLQKAGQKGDRGKMAINPKVAGMKEQILAMKELMPKMEEALVDDMVENHQDQRVIMFGTRNHLFKLVEKFEDKGVTGAYAPGSVFLYGGLFDNGVEPENWKARTREALGLNPEAMMEVYGMSEMLNFFDRCEHGHYHLPASIVPYVLQPDSGEQKPRSGVQTGRFAFFDLMAESYWGGFVTGDKVTLNWDGGCACGRKGVYIEGDVIPLSMDEGGDDKINCSGSTEAHNTAVDYILDL
jgi:hypothetical protein